MLNQRFLLALRLGILVVFSLAFLLLAPPATSYAATFTVNDNGDAGDASPGNGSCGTSMKTCTLRAAIEENNASRGGNTISIPAMTIVLTSQTELQVTRSVTIHGAGQGSTIIDGNNATRVFNFAVYSGTHTMSDLTIQNGNCGACDSPHPGYPFRNGGGGVFNEATLTLTNVTVKNSKATQGGGVFNELDSGQYVPVITLNSVTLTNNLATSRVTGQGGGGLWNGGTLTASKLTISSNTALQGGGFYNNSSQAVNLNGFTINNNAAIYGGGMNNETDDKVNFSSGMIADNVSDCCNPDNGENTGGAGIYNGDGTMSLTDVTLSGNQATSPQGYGGAIVNIKAMNLNRVTVYGNKASYGAGVYSLGNLNVTNSTITGNTGTNTSSGGGLFNTGAGQAILNSVTLDGNTASYAGGIDNSRNITSGAITVFNSILFGNIITLPSMYGPNCEGRIGSTGYNLVGTTEGCSFIATIGDQTNAIDAGLGPLWNYGGATSTQILLPSSPALNTGAISGCPSTDQRNFTRPQTGRCDKGAFEFRPGSDKPLQPSLWLPLTLR